MKFYFVQTDERKRPFRTKDAAITFLVELKEHHPDEYESATFDMFDITVDADTIMTFLEGEGGYCNDIVNLELPK
jgi:hypothetical protein